jgi:hypothetical protein
MRLTRIVNDTNRAELMAALKAAPIGAQFDLVDDPRTSKQNRHMWALLNEVSAQLAWNGERYVPAEPGDPGRRYGPDDWKCAFMHAMGFTCGTMRALRGEGMVAIGYRSSHLDKETFADLIETIYSQGLQRGVVFPG